MEGRGRPEGAPLQLSEDEAGIVSLTRVFTRWVTGWSDLPPNSSQATSVLNAFFCLRRLNKMPAYVVLGVRKLERGFRVRGEVLWAFGAVTAPSSKGLALRGALEPTLTESADALGEQTE